MSYKRKYHLLLLGIPLLLLLSWKLSISRTAELQKEYTQLKSNQLRYSNPDRTILALEQELASIREADQYDPALLDQQLMEEVSRKAGPYRIRLEAFPESHSFRSNNYQVQTFRLRFSGRYSNLLKFIHYAEHEINSCKMVSVAFDRKVHRKTGEKLYADLYFQSLFKIHKQGNDE